jgi:hypothetical protein
VKKNLVSGQSITASPADRTITVTNSFGESQLLDTLAKPRPGQEKTSGMFTPNALPAPSTFGRDYHPLRLTSDLPRPQPTGECRFILLHPTPKQQQCPCQSYHPDQASHGCECGHQACYHVHTSSVPERGLQVDSFQAASQASLHKRVKRLEEALHNEREIRDNAVLQERHAWEREVRILREALAPFYQTEQEMKKKLVEDGARW